MSRIGKKPIEIPAGVTVTLDGDVVKVKGPKGELSAKVVDHVSAAVEGKELVFTRDSDLPKARGNHGLVRALAQNMVTGVTKGFSKQLLVQGIGYRADVRGNLLVMNLGYSHPIEHPIPSDIQISVDKDYTITVSGIDKGRVGQVAADIRSYRTPDRYKGKGVRYKGERILLKAGKSA